MDLPLLSRSGNHNPSRCCSVLAACNIPSRGRVVVDAWPLVAGCPSLIRVCLALPHGLFPYQNCMDSSGPRQYRYI
jgi:hypothetical protein